MSKPSFDQVDYGEPRVSSTDANTVYAAELYEVPVEEVTPEMRAKAKTARFGELYGGGPMAIQDCVTGRANSQAPPDMLRHLQGLSAQVGQARKPECFARQYSSIAEGCRHCEVRINCAIESGEPPPPFVEMDFCAVETRMLAHMCQVPQEALQSERDPAREEQQCARDYFQQGDEDVDEQN